MGKSKKPAKKIGGPFLAAAVFCDNIMEDSNGILTVIRIIDSFNIMLHWEAPADMPSKARPIEIAPNMLLTFRTGDSPGKHLLRLIVQTPSGKRHKGMTKELDFPEAQHGGYNVKTNTILKLFTSGVFWIDVILDGKRLTRMPLNVSITRAEKPK